MRVLDYFKAKDPRFATANEDKLVLWIGRTKPEFLQDPEFKAAFERLTTPSKSLQPQFAKPFASAATPPTQEQQLVAAAQERETERRTYEATRSLFADDPQRLATLDAAYAGLREEQGVGLLTDKAPSVPKLTPDVVEQTTGLGPGASKVVAGAQQGMAGLVDFFLTPVGLTTLGIGSMGAGASRMAAAIFAADMAAHYPEQVAGLVSAIQSKDPEATTRSLIGVGLTPLFVKGALSHPSPAAQESALRTQALLDSAKAEALRLNDPNVSGIPYAEALAMDRAVEPRMTTGDTVTPTYDPLTTFARKLRSGEATIPAPTPGIALPAARAVRPTPEGGRLGWNRTAEEMTGEALPGAFGAASKEAPLVAAAATEAKPVAPIEPAPPTPKDAVTVVEAKALRPEDPLPPRRLTQAEEDARIASHATMTREQLQAEVAGVGTDRTVLQKQYFDELAKTNPELVNTVATPETAVKMTDDWHNWLAQRTLLHTSAWTELFKRDHPSKPATAALGVRPAGSEMLDPIVNWLQREAPTGVEVDLVTPTRPIPRLAEYSGLKQTVTKPEGMGRLPWWLPAGRIFDPRYKGGDPVRGAFIVNAYSKGMGDGMAKVIGADLQRFDAAFKGLPMSDLIEAHLRGEAVLNPEQTAAVTAAKPYIDDVLAMLAEEGLPRAVALQEMSDSFGGSAYFPRTPIAKEVGGTEVRGGSARGMGLSRTPGSLRERSYVSEAEGVAGGIKYEDRFSVRVANHVRQAYAAVANQRLLTDPALKGESVRQRLESLAEDNIDELRLAKQALDNGGIVQADYDALFRRAERANPELFEEWRGRASDLGWGESSVRRAEFRGYIYDAATAAKLEKYFNPQEHEFVKFLTVPSQISKGLVLALDNSAPLVQGLPLLSWSLYKRNNVWGRAVVQNLKAWRNPEYLASYLGRPDNKTAAAEFVQLGGSLGRAEDFMAGVQEGSFLERFPVTRGVARRAAGAFGAFLDVGKLEMWKALRAGTPRAEWRSVAETVENVLGSARSRTIGTRRGVLDAEQILATAPSYYKSAGNLIGQLFARGASGKLAREAIMSFGAGILLTHIAAMYFVGGLSPEEIWDKLKRGDISVPVKLGKQTYNVSASHILISLSKLTAQLGQRIYGSITGEAKPITGGGVEDNPLLRWIWAHSGPLVSLGIETVQGRDFLGQPTTFGASVAKRLTPLWGSQVIQSFKDEPTVGGVVGDSLASAIGINAYTTPVIQQRRMESNRISRELYGRDYSGLNIREQLEVARKVQEQPRFQKKGDTDPRSLANAQWYDAQKLKRITKSVGPELADQVAKLDTKLRGYDSKVTLRGVTIPLTDEQQKVLEGFVVEEYKRVLPAVLPKLGRTERIDTRQKLLDEALGKARERAKARFIRADIGTATPSPATPPSP